MSGDDLAAVAALAQLAFAADGALLGIGVAYVAYRGVRNLTATSSALRKIFDAPSVQPSDLRSLISFGCDGDISSGSSSDSSSVCDGEKLVMVRGIVKAANCKGLRRFIGGNVIVSKESREKGVILQRTDTCIYNEWRGGVFGWTADLLSLVSRFEWRGVFKWTADLLSRLSGLWKEQESSSVRMVPFILVEVGKRPESDYVVVNMEGSKHPLPLSNVYHHFQPISASPYTFLQAFLGLQYPIGVLHEEEILPLGRDVIAVGICNLKKGIPEIRSCKDLPYFLSNLTKDQMVQTLSFRMKVLTCCSLVFGSLAIGILGHSIARNWIRWKEWRHQQRGQQGQNSSPNNEIPADVDAEEESGDVPDGELCVICLMRRRRFAFIPCGHLVCCQRCALSVERDVSLNCPVCRQPIRSSVRIYDS